MNKIEKYYLDEMNVWMRWIYTKKFEFLDKIMILSSERNVLKLIGHWKM